MKTTRDIHPDFLSLLELKQQPVIKLFKDLRAWLLDIYPDANELLYHTHALTTVFSISEKLSDAYCMIPIYTNHLNLGFNKGTLIEDPHRLLAGTGNLIRHIPVQAPEDYRNNKVKKLVQSAIELALEDMATKTKATRKTISKIKKAG
ncbi:MAG: DUF1801 domain-containing protein [Chitinophagales bacterium]|nr:DUF1801 domain-containing protein [Chitinophagales bacterium]